MKTLLSLAGGALTITEEGGVFTLSINGTASLGGGTAAGILSVEGSGSAKLSGKQLFDLGATVIESHSPAPVAAVEKTVQALADAEISGA